MGGGYLHRLLPLGALLLGLTACESEPDPFLDGPGGGSGKGGGKKPAAQASGDTGAAVERTFRDTDFVESEMNRDPFRSYENELRAKGPLVAQRTVLMPNTPVDAMRLIAIVTGIDQPRAMIVDEKGVGYVTTRGDFVGKADVVQSGGGENLPVMLNWRVDRIRENEVVLAREDPTGPNRPPLTKVIPLHGGEDEAAAQAAASNSEG